MVCSSIFAKTNLNVHLKSLKNDFRVGSAVVNHWQSAVVKPSCCHYASIKSHVALLPDALGWNQQDSSSLSHSRRRFWPSDVNLCSPQAISFTTSLMSHYTHSENLESFFVWLCALTWHTHTSFWWKSPHLVYLQLILPLPSWHGNSCLKWGRILSCMRYD